MTSPRGSIVAAPVRPPTHHLARSPWAATARESVAAEGDRSRRSWSAGPIAMVPLRSGWAGSPWLSSRARPDPDGAAPPPGDLSAPAHHRRRFR